MTEDISLSFNKKEAEILLNSLNLSKELNLLPDDSHLLTALINKTFKVAKNLIDENIYTKEEINRCEQKLKEYENKYRFFIENFPGIAFQGYPDFSNAFFDGNIEEMTGYTEEDFTSGRIKWDNIIHPDDLERIIKLVKKFHSTSMNSDIREYRIINKNGKVRWVMENIQKLYDNRRKEEMVQGTIINITESKLAEQKLKESEEKYRNILENMQDGYYEVDLQGNWTFANNYICNYLGYSREELLGRNYQEFLDKDTVKEVFNRFNQVYKDEIPRNTFETYVIRNDGKKRFIGGTIYLKYDSQGKKVGFAGFSQDTTEHKKIEEQLLENEDKFRTLFEQAEDSILLIDMETGELVEFNNKACENLGYSREEFKNIKIPDFEIIESPEEVKKHLEKVVREGTEIFETKHRTKNGEIRNVIVSSKAINTRGKNFVQSIYRDITERKKAEEELIKAKTFSESIIDSLPGIFYLFDEKGKFLRWNQNFEEVSECSAEEIAKMNILDFFKGEDKKHIAERIQEVFIRGKSTAEADFISKSGKKTSHYFTGLRIIINNTPYLGGMGIDISERKKAEKKLQESEKRYRDFISVASHEFKTPLIPIIGIPQIILKDTNLTEQQKDFIDEILLSGKKLNKLMDNLLDTTKIDAKGIELNKHVIEINALIEQCINDLSFLIQYNNHTLVKRLQENVKLNIDNIKISQVLNNFISNAIKYTPQNGIIEISTQIDKDNNFIFSIKDNGIGIDKKDADLVFQKFGKIRGVEISQYNLDTYGNGLGLYISKEIIKLHGGEIWFESEGRNKGTKFYFKIPNR